MLYVRLPLLLLNVEDFLHERGIDISQETVRFWWPLFGPIFAAEICKRRIEGMRSSHWRWHLDDMFVKIDGERHYLWRAVDHQGEVPESYVTKTRDKRAALKFLKNAFDTRKCHDAIAARGAAAIGHSLVPAAFVRSLPPRVRPHGAGLRPSGCRVPAPRRRPERLHRPRHTRH